MGKKCTSVKRLMAVRLTGCREIWTPALIKSEMLTEVKWMLACALVEKDSTSCEIVLIKWKLNAKHKMPEFYHQNVAGSPSLFCLVNWSSSNQKSRSHLFTWPNTESVSNIKKWNLRFRTDLVNGNKKHQRQQTLFWVSHNLMCFTHLSEWRG